MILKKLTVAIVAFLLITRPVAAAGGGINIGDRLDEFDQAAAAAGAGGWVYIMACPGDIAALNQDETLMRRPNTNVVIRGHYPDDLSLTGGFEEGESRRGESEGRKTFAEAWANALLALKTPNKVYFVPVNEPNNFNGDGSPGERYISAGVVNDYIGKLKNALDGKGLRGGKVDLLSPMIDVYQVADGHGSGYLEQLNLGQFDGIGLSLYGQYEGGNLVVGPPLKRGDYEQFLSYGKPIFGLEAGVVVPGNRPTQVVYGSEAGGQAHVLTTKYFNEKRSTWDSDGRFKMFSIFSYNPESYEADGWIYGPEGTDVLAAMKAYSGTAPTPNTGPTDATLDLSKYPTCGASVIKEVPGDLGFTVKVERQEKQTFPIAQTIFNSFNKIVNGIFKPSDNKLPAPITEGQLAQQLEYVNGQMMPESLKKNVRRAPAQARQINSKACLVDAATGQQKEYLNTGEIIRGQTDQTIGALTTFTQQLNWMLGPLKRKNLNYKGPILKLKSDSYADCGSDTEAQPQNPRELSSANQNEFNGMSLIFSFLSKTIAQIRDGDIIKEILRVVFQSELNQTAKILNPNSTVYTCNFASCTPAETAVSLETPGADFGLAEAFRPDALNLRAGSAHGAIETSYAVTSSETVPGQTKYNLAGLLADAKTFIDCTSAPASWQTDSVNHAGLEICQEKNFFNVQTAAGALGNLSAENNISGDNPLTYEIPYRNGSCSVTAATIANAANELRRRYPAYATAGAGNLNNMWQEIQNKARENGWNPAFVLALWIEESAAGGAGNAYGMGCIYHTVANGAGMTQRGGSPTATREQYECLFERDYNDFNRFMCTYSGEKRDENGHCTSFTNNPNFIHNLRTWYNIISANLPASCQIK